MNDQKSDYTLPFRGTEWDRALSPEQIQKVVADWAAWFERLTREGKAIGGHPLAPEGKTVSGAGGRNVADGPFAESKEAIGGYFYLRVSGMDEAVAIARQCPGLDFGVTVEVRPVAEQCSVRARLAGAGMEVPEMQPALS